MPYHRKLPHLYGIPMIHKLDIPLRPTASSNYSPCYVLAEFLHKILSCLTSDTDFLMRNAEGFIKLVWETNRQNEDCLVNFDVNLFTHVPLEEVLQVIRNRLDMDPYFLEHSYKLNMYWNNWTSV
jgi:hypothetical protein